MEQLVNAPSPPASFGALLRARRHRACLSQEQLAARAELSERTVRDLEVDRAGRRAIPRSGCWRTRSSWLSRSKRPGLPPSGGRMGGQRGQGRPVQAARCRCPGA